MLTNHKYYHPFYSGKCSWGLDLKMTQFLADFVARHVGTQYLPGSLTMDQVTGKWYDDQDITFIDRMAIVDIHNSPFFSTQKGQKLNWHSLNLRV